MTSPIAPPAAFGPISGTALTSASPEALAKIFDTLELASLEQENFRLERAIQQLVQSNKEIEDFIELERQEQLALYRQQQEQQEQAQQGRASNGKVSEHPSVEPDPEFVLAIEENKGVISKYERTCAELKKAILKRRAEEEEP